MNIFALVLKQMRQRLLTSILTVLSVALGVALAIAILSISRQGQAVFAQTDYGYDLIVGPKASPTQLVLNTVYHLDVSPGNIPYALYEDLASTNEASAFGEGKKNPFRGQVQWAVPYAVGDSYEGHRIVATTPALFGFDSAGAALPGEKTPEYRVGQHYVIAEGRVFGAAKFEAVIGSETARRTGLKVGSEFHATHGMPGPSDIPDIHEETWKVVGILAPTHTANDRVLFIPLPTFYAIFEHEAGLEAIQQVKNKAEGVRNENKKPEASSQKSVELEEKAYTLSPDGTVTPKLAKAEWEVSAVLVKARSAYTLQQLIFTLRNRPEAVGVNPASAMQAFFDTFLQNLVLVLLLIAALVIVVGGVSILVSIYNAVSSRGREIAILRALGATRMRIVAVICLEAAVVGLLGAVAGLVGGHALAALASTYLAREVGQGFTWWAVSGDEVLGLAVVVAMAAVAGLVPALKAYRVPVAENLVS